jgi:hypothetical protein
LASALAVRGKHHGVADAQDGVLALSSKRAKTVASAPMALR